MNYGVQFKVKAEGVDFWARVMSCHPTFPKSAKKSLEKITGLSWEEDKSVGFCVDVMPIIKSTLDELRINPHIYEPCEPKAFWAEIEILRYFLGWLLWDWEDFKEKYPELVSVVTFWIY